MSNPLVALLVIALSIAALVGSIVGISLLAGLDTKEALNVAALSLPVFTLIAVIFTH